MTHRSYDQYCGLAGTLDLVGERWTLLIVRELMAGPQRYTDLAQSLPGIGTSLLASRLKKLESSGVITKDWLAPPAASAVYRLSGIGEELARALTPLMLWGLRHALPAQPGPETQVKPAWALMTLVYGLDPAALAGIDATYTVFVDGEPVHLRFRDGKASVLAGSEHVDADATVRLDAATVAALGAGRVSVLDATLTGRLTIEGDEAAIATLIDLFAMTMPSV